MIEEITYLGKPVFTIERFIVKNQRIKIGKDEYMNIGSQETIGINYFPNGYEFNPRMTDCRAAWWFAKII